CPDWRSKPRRLPRARYESGSPPRSSRLAPDPIRAERHPAHGIGIGRLMADLMRWSRRLGDAIGKPSQPGDFDFDQIADVHRARVLGCARQNHIAREQRDEAAEIRKDIVNREDHLTNRALLYDFAVDIGVQD